MSNAIAFNIRRAKPEQTKPGQGTGKGAYLCILGLGRLAQREQLFVEHGRCEDGIAKRVVRRRDVCPDVAEVDTDIKKPLEHFYEFLECLKDDSGRDDKEMWPVWGGSGLQGCLGCAI